MNSARQSRLMASMELKATNFLSQKDSNYINFFLYGEEPSLTFRCLKHVLLNEDMKMIERYILILMTRTLSRILRNQ